MKLKIIILFIILLPQFVKAQYNPLITICQFLDINYLPEIEGVGGIGTVSLNDNNETGLYKNPALLNTQNKVLGFTTTNSSQFSHGGIYNAGIYYSLNNKLTFGYVFNYFNSAGLYSYFNAFNSNLKSFDYYQSLRASYSITNNLRFGVGVKHLHSNMKYNGAINYHYIINSYAIDLGTNYSKVAIEKGNFSFRYDLGADIQNIGPKVSYTDDVSADFIPISLNLAIGLSPQLKISEQLSMGINAMYQASKYLVPTPPIYKEDENGHTEFDDKGNFLIESGKDPNVNVFRGMIQSFYDAPNGAEEEFQEIMHRVGGESFCKYKTFDFILRFGRFFENEYKGNRKIQSFGVGAVAYNFKIDVFTNRIINRDYDNTWGISLGYRKVI